AIGVEGNMMIQDMFRNSWMCLLLFSFCTCAPAQKSQTGGGYHSRGSGYRRGSTGSVGGAAFDINTGSGPASSFYGAGYSATQDAAIAQMVADLLRLSPYGSRPLLQSHWSYPHVPVEMVETRPVFPSSLIVQTNSGYQRARDFRTDSKYTEDTFDHIPQPGTPQNPGSGSKGHQLGQ
ncbi:hypothetical protein WJF85_29015, partial [Salmonella enterica subsp. enterica serovar Corvallis]